VSDTLVRTVTAMGTVVTIQVVGHGETPRSREERGAAVDRALAWFERINDSLTRFDPRSELSRLTTQVGRPVAVSALLYEAVRFALAVAEESGGAFDPTIGHQMEQLGFNREFRTGAVVHTDAVRDDRVSHRDVHLDPYHHSIMLLRPLLLDLGAVAKGLAIDMAVRELMPFGNFAVDAGGDLYLGGLNAEGAPWSVGIRHPRAADQLIATLRVSDRAVCTSGDYERPTPIGDGGHHILDPRAGTSADALASVTVLAPSAMVADALATAAFVMGPADGLALLEAHGVDGLLVTPALDVVMTPGMPIA
jgi:thiamine biosynthesis lipoprotein